MKEVELTEEEKRAKDLELQAVKVADGDNSRLGEALELLNRAVAEAPGYASAYNNRAQVYTVEPPNKIHLGTRANVLYSEVSFIQRLEMC